MTGRLATETSQSAASKTHLPEADLRGGNILGAHTQTASGQVIPFKQALLVALAAGLGYGFNSYAVNIFGMLSPLMVDELNISVTAIGAIGSLFLVGYTLGTIFFGYLADRIGRRNSLRFSIVLYGTTTVLGGLVSNLYSISALRFLTGIGGAGELAVGAPYTAEMWPPKYRAIGTGGIMFSLYSLGYIVAAVAALVIVPHYGWRWAFIFAAVPAALVLWLRNVVQELAKILKKLRRWKSVWKWKARREFGKVFGKYQVQNAELWSAGFSIQLMLVGTGESRTS